MRSGSDSTSSSGGCGGCRVRTDPDPGRARPLAALLVALAALGPPAVAGYESVAADLAPTIAAEVDRAPVNDEAAARSRLEEIFAAAPPFRFEAGPLALSTDRRWFSTVPGPSSRSPVLVARRWPGDSVLALWSLAGAEPTPPGTRPPVPRADLAVSARAAPGGLRIWRGTIETDGGSRPAVWAERRVPGAPTRVGALLVPGDAGLGADAVAGLALELRVALDRLRIDPERASEIPALPSGTDLTVPDLGPVPGDADEARDPWQVVRGTGFTLGLPPGLRARRTDRGVAPPRTVPGGLLWIRGRFRDRDGTAVAVGDGDRAGYLAVVRRDGTGDASADSPVGLSSGTRIATERFDIAAERPDVLRASAERWEEPGFGGTWLVFRLERAADRVEIALPVLAGRRSPALFWIPVTWRPEPEPPAPPPVDPASRFGIRFERLVGSARRDRPWAEGDLATPGLRLEVPRGWAPVVSLRSRDGFPIVLLDGRGTAVATLARLRSGDRGLRDPEQRGYVAQGGAHRRHARAIFRGPAGEILWTGREGGFLLTPAPENPPEPGAWQRLVDSARLLRSAR